MSLEKQKSEVWVDTSVPGYQVSNLGRIYSVRNEGKFLKPVKGRRGHLKVKLGGQQWTLAHVVYSAFEGRRPTRVKFRDGDKGNCELENILEGGKDGVSRTNESEQI